MIDFKKHNLLVDEEVNQYLKSVINKKLFNNGYIFFGAEGLGKKQKAFEFIEEIFKQFSTNANIEEKLINNNHPDFLIIEPTSSSRSNQKKSSDSSTSNRNSVEIIKINQIREINTFLSKKSIESEKKIVLIIDAHLLNEAASNCLLKTLEEPSNGIFILLTSKLNALLDTIKSRCQLVRFKSFSSEQLEIILKNKFDSSELEILESINFEELVNSAIGSPSKILNQVKIWNKIPKEIIKKLNFPSKDYFTILEISKSISEQLNTDQQIFLINLIQQIWWRKTKSAKLVKKLETLKLNIKNLVQPRLAWEVTLLRISLEDL